MATMPVSTPSVEEDLGTDGALDDIVAEQCARHRVPGCAVGVLIEGRSVFAGYGTTSTTDPLAVDADTLFFIGSTTKTLTATVVMRLVAEGKVALDDPVIAHLPQLRLSDTTVREEVTVGQLLDHTAGWRGDVELDTGWGPDALDRAVTETAAMPQQFPPDAAVSYNNLAVVIAGKVVEQVTGQGYDTAVRERLLDPLGMGSTFFFPWEVATRRLAVGHTVGADGPTPAHVWPMSRALHPAGGAISSLRDQLRYARFHLDGMSVGAPPLDDAHRLLMQRPRVALPSVLSGIGLSWLLRDRAGVRMLTHGGNCSNLYVSALALCPDQHLAVTVLTNSRGGSPVGAAVTEWAVQHYLNQPAVPAPTPLPLAAELAAEYCGRYDAGQWALDVTAGDGTLFVQMVITEIPPGTPEEVLAALQSSPTQVMLVASDVLAAVATPTDTVGDFVRDRDGRVGWLRYGLRLARRVP